VDPSVPGEKLREVINGLLGARFGHPGHVRAVRLHTCGYRSAGDYCGGEASFNGRPGRHSCRRSGHFAAVGMGREIEQWAPLNSIVYLHPGLDPRDSRTESQYQSPQRIAFIDTEKLSLKPEGRYRSLAFRGLHARP